LDLHSKKILIFGIDSFTGKHMEKFFLKHDYFVYGTVLQKISNDVNVYQCDVLNKENIKRVIELIKPSYIINLTGISFVGNKNRELFYRVNLIGVENILESILQVNNYYPKKVILVSSATVYGNQKEIVLNEELCPNPINHYGLSKFAMEQIAKNYFDKLNIIITRPFNYTGVGQSNEFVIPKIVSHYKNKKQFIELGNIDVYREFNDVEYICEVYKNLLESNVSSEIINIASSRLLTLKDVLLSMDKIAGYSIKVKINNKFVRKNEIKSLSGSIDKLFHYIRKVQQKDFVDTLKEMYND